jgi:DNA-binding MarR family transcriptional regulator
MNLQGQRDLLLLTEVERNGAVTQRSLATKLGVALGLTNLYLKRLARKGYIKITTIPSQRVRYLLTPQGFAEKSRLTYLYMQYSLSRTIEVRARRADAVVVVSVVDHGHGIDEEASAMLFTPFFTTKSEGMGMGLNICRSIIEFHDGRLWVEPNPGGGTIFNFTLPMEVVDAPSAQSESRVQRA